MDGDRPRLSGNRNCYRLSRVSWALAQISCWFLYEQKRFADVLLLFETDFFFWKRSFALLLRRLNGILFERARNSENIKI